MVVVGREGAIFVACGVVLVSGKVVDINAEGIVPTDGDGVITED